LPLSRDHALARVAFSSSLPARLLGLLGLGPLALGFGE
jgi:hypothetical protein